MLTQLLFFVDLQDKKKDKDKISSDDIGGPLTIGGGIGKLDNYVLGPSSQL